MLLAIIPARGGSKGIPRKNLALLGGRPLIEYSIEVAQRATVVDDILLTTDDDEIADAGRRMGLDMSYRRPAELAGDATPMIDTLEHAIAWQRTHRKAPDEIILLQPTSPLRSPEDLDGATRMLRETGAPSVVSVHPMGEHPSECVVGKGTNWRFLLPPPPTAARRQDYQHDAYFINGAIYVTRTQTLLKRRGFLFPGETAMFDMPRHRGLDIDSPLDLKIAEAVLQSRSEAEGV